MVVPVVAVNTRGNEGESTVGGVEEEIECPIFYVGIVVVGIVRYSHDVDPALVRAQALEPT